MERAYYNSRLVPSVRMDSLVGAPGGEVRPTLSLTDRIKVGASLKDFSASFNQEELNALVAPYIRDKSLLQDGNFHLTSDYAIGKGNTSFYHHIDTNIFNSDGVHSLVIGYKKRSQRAIRWFANTSFSVGEEARNYNGLDFNKDLPLILQIQGSSPTEYSLDWGRYQEALALLRKLRWEPVLLKLLKGWATSEDIPMIYLLPGDKNKWIGTNWKRKQLFHLRYDVAAKRSGFKMQENGYWGVQTGGNLIEKAKVI